MAQYPQVEKCNLASDQVKVCPLSSYEARFLFKASWGDKFRTLTVNVPRLRWRVLMPGKEAPEWGNKPITLSVHDLEQSDYPWFVCEMGQ